VLEDEWLIAEQISSALSEAGYDVVGPVGRVEQAIALVRSGGVDAALIDINVHNDRSFRLAEQLVEQTIPFAFLSGYSGTELPRHLAGRPLMQKPVTASTLRRCVDSLLDEPVRRH
jgi:two-component SAPR family response regulator